MVVRVATVLEAPADTVWALLKRKETLLYVTRGLLGLPDAGAWPGEYREGLRARGRLRFFHLVPGWEHEIHVVSIDDGAREMRTRERGGIVRVWRHRLKVEPIPGERSLYTDEIEVQAGLLTPVVWAIAHLFYRYRQGRWRALARVLP